MTLTLFQGHGYVRTINCKLKGEREEEHFCVCVFVCVDVPLVEFMYPVFTALLVFVLLLSLLSLRGMNAVLGSKNSIES